MKGSAGNKVIVSLVTRNKKKFVTVVKGLAAYSVDLKKASKAFSGAFASSASVTGDDEVSVTGDHTEAIIPLICSKFKEVR